MHVFIDTNIYLAFFHLTGDDLEELKKLIVLVDQKKVSLYVTDQVKQEFTRNREAKIADALQMLKDQQRKLSFPQMCKDYPEYDEARKHHESSEKLLGLLQEKLRADAKAAKLKADQIIKDLFSKATFIPTDLEAVQRARLRVDVGNPPGKNGSLGDAINWEQLLMKVPEGSDLHVVSGDRDFAGVLTESEIKQYLLYEWQRSKKGGVTLYKRLASFFQQHFPDIKMAAALEKQLLIEQLVNSPNFATTHKTVAKLAGYNDFTVDEAEELLAAVVENGQIRRIATDTDVKSFITAIANSNDGKLDGELVEKALALLAEDDASSFFAALDVDDEEPPF